MPRQSALLLLLLGATLCLGQAITCEPFAGVPAACASIISGNVYIPAGTTQAALSTNATTAVSFFPVLTPDCVNAILPYLCASFFRPCGAADELPPICPDVCAATVGNCSTTLAAPLVGGCALLTDVTGELVFQNARGNVTCFQPASTVTNVTCPIYTGFNGTLCAPLCPLPPFSEARYYRRFDIANRLLGALSILGELFFIIPWTYHGIRARNLHLKYPYWLCVCYLAISVSAAMSWGGTRKWRCVDDFTPRTQHNSGAVVVQSLLFVTAIVSCSAWICCLIGSLFFKILFREKGFYGRVGTIFNAPEWIVYHTISWGSGLLIWIIGTGMEVWEISPLGAWPGPSPLVNKWNAIGLLAIPLLFFSTIALFLSTVLIWNVYMLANLRGLRTQLRLCAMCFWFVFCALYLVSQFLYFVKLKGLYFDYFACLLQGGTDCVLDHGISYAANFVSLVLLTSLGVVFFALFLSEDALKQWRDLFALAKPKSSAASTSGGTPTPSGAASGAASVTSDL